MERVPGLRRLLGRVRGQQSALTADEGQPEEPTTASRGVFVSYRRDDSAFAARFVFDVLRGRFGDGIVFSDSDSLDVRPGRDYVDALNEALDSCDFVLAFVGAGWLNAKDRKGRRCLDLEDDFVRLELETALQKDIPVVPALVGDAIMPLREQLPSSLASFARLQAVSVERRRVRRDIDDMVPFLEAIPRRNQTPDSPA